DSEVLICSVSGAVCVGEGWPCVSAAWGRAGAVWRGLGAGGVHVAGRAVAGGVVAGAGAWACADQSALQRRPPGRRLPGLGSVRRARKGLLAAWSTLST